MLLRYFNSNRVGVLILLVGIPLLYWLPVLFSSRTAAILPATGTLPGDLFHYLNSQLPVLSGLIVLVLVLLNAYLLVQLNTIHIFIPAKTQLPAFFYLLMAIGHNPAFVLNPALVASTLFIFVLFRLMATYKVDGISYNFLDAGFLTALASLLFFPVAGFLVFLFLALALLRPFNWREYAYVLVGMALPYFFLYSGYYLANKPVTLFFNSIEGLMERQNVTLRLISWIGAAFIAVMLLYGSYFMLTTIDNMKIQSRKMFFLFLWFFLMSVALGIAVPAVGTNMVYFAGIPTAFLFSHYFHKCAKNWLNELLFSLFLVLLILMRLF